MGLCFAIFVFLTFRGPLASHDSNPYLDRTRIARYDATKQKRLREEERETLKTNQKLLFLEAKTGFFY